MQPVGIAPSLIDQTEFEQPQVRLIKRVLQACIREQLLSYTLYDQVLCIALPRLHKTIVIDQVRRSSLQKFKMKGVVKLAANDQTVALTDLHYLLSLLTTELQDSIEPVQWQVFLDEMDNCAVHDALSVKHMKKYNEHLAQIIQQSGQSTLIDFLRTHYSAEQQVLFFEQWAASGHPYHPCHKTKLGFNQQAVLKFSPEFNQDITLHVAALAKTAAHTASLDEALDYSAWFAQQFPQQWLAYQTKLSQHNLSSSDYLPMFIHPWQYENVVKQLFASLLTAKQLLVFTDIGLLTKASSSFRTLIAKEAGGKPHIKLPVAVHSTSTLRTVSPASVRNGPACSKIIRAILAKESNISRYCKLAEDICGVHIAGYESDIARHLSVLYRENPAAYVNDKQMPMMVAALFETSPASKLPLFIELLHNAVGKELSAAKAYFDSYCAVKLQAFLDFLLLYGIALDAHQQNTLTVFEEDKPVFMITRDLGDIRIHTPTFKQAGLQFDAYPSAIMTDDADEVTKKFLHCVIQYHLGELVVVLAEHYQVPEVEFWRIVKDNILKRFAAVQDRISAERFQQVCDVIFAENLKLKGLMRMRMENQNTKYSYIDFNNPLRTED